MTVCVDLDPVSSHDGRLFRNGVDECPAYPQAHVVRIHEEVDHLQSIVATRLRSHKADDVARDLGDKDDVVGAGGIELRKLWMREQKIAIPFIRQ